MRGSRKVTGKGSSAILLKGRYRAVKGRCPKELLASKEGLLWDRCLLIRTYE